MTRPASYPSESTRRILQLVSDQTRRTVFFRGNVGETVQFLEGADRVGNLLYSGVPDSDGEEYLVG